MDEFISIYWFGKNKKGGGLIDLYNSSGHYQLGFPALYEMGEAVVKIQTDSDAMEYASERLDAFVEIELADDGRGG